MGVLNKAINGVRGITTCATNIANKTSQSRVRIAVDIVKCMIRYSASPNNYEKFEFYNLTAKQRSTYVTYGLSRKMIKRFNCQADVEAFENKLIFAEKFSNMFDRMYLNVEKMKFSDFEIFCKGMERFICKPYAGSQGRGIKVFHLSDYNFDLKSIYNEIKTNYFDGYMLEEWIVQHPVLDRIYPNAVNCLRIITVYDGDQVHLITGGVTFGICSEIANGSQPSIVAPLNFETGEFDKPAASFDTELYENHPTTGERILGVKLPYWEETKALLDKACKIVPSVGYIGWDIAITPKGPIIIEGNTTPGYKYYQIPKHLDDGIGNRRKYERYL